MANLILPHSNPISMLFLSSSNHHHKSPSKPLLSSCYYYPLSLLLLLLSLLSPVANSAAITTNQRHHHTWDGVTLTQSDYQTLLIFKSTIDPKSIFLTTWNTTSPRQSICATWPGLRCQSGRVIAIHLPFKGLYGQITPQITHLSALRTISLHDNFITGTIPSSISLLTNLRSLYLFNNRLTGQIPPQIFSSIPNLLNLDLSRNSLNGTLPHSISNSTRLYRLILTSNSLSGPIPPSLGGQMLSILDLSTNNFSGQIPPSLAALPHLTAFNVSHNDLSGAIPPPLTQKFDPSSFIGNPKLQLCGFSKSLTIPCPSSPSSSAPAPSPQSSSPDFLLPPPTTHTRKLTTKDIILIAAGSLLLILLLLCCILLCCLIRKRRRMASSTGPTRGIKSATAAAAASSTSGTATGNGSGKLVLFDGPFVFTAEDLLCATAEIMAKSPYGTVYKATLEDGNQVAVKRLREKLAKNPNEFETEVAALGKIRHANLLAMRAYYLGPKGEKLLVYDYLSKGSLSAFLHGGRCAETVIDWPVRINIITGVARGLLHLHSHHNLIHGNLTSGDIYLDDQTTPRISDYGLTRLMTDAANNNVISTSTTTTGSVSAYRPPELHKTRKPTTKTDIYSLGVIILELLTGKSPNETINGMELPQWVASVVKEEWSNEVFDLELMSSTTTKTDASGDDNDEMANTLKLALHMVDPSPDARPDAAQVVQQLEQITPHQFESAVAVADSDDDDEDK